MKPIHSSSPCRWLVLAMAAAVAPPLARAQRGVFAAPASIGISAPQNYVVAARTLALTATAFNARGAALRGRNIAWQVSDPSKASIDARGVLHGIAPGVETITATDTDANVSSTWNAYVYPGSVSVTASAARLQI